MKQLFKQLPGLHAVYRRLFRVGAPGRWLFRSDTLDWMRHRELRRQLPAPFRAFAIFCRAQSFSGLPVVFGSLAFNIARRAHIRRRGGAIRIDIAGRVMYLDPRDPEMLQVPGTVLTLAAPGSILARFLSEGDSFVDVGANHGAFSVAASTIIGTEGSIVAFEPQPVLRELVERSLTESGLNNFTVYPHACSDRNGEAEFFVPRIASGLAGLHANFSGRAAHERLRVPLIRLDDALEPLELPNAVFIKLDVEGHELPILRGGISFIRERRPRILMEVNPKAMAAAGTTLEELRALLADLGCRGYRPVEHLDRLFDLHLLDAREFHNILLEFG